MQMNGTINRRRRRMPAKGVIWGAAVLMACWVLTGYAAERETIDRVVAYVNDDIIVLSELEEEMAPYTERLEGMGYSEDRKAQMLFKLRTDMLNQLVERKLTDQEIKKAGIVIDEETIDKSIENLKRMNHLTEETLVEALKAQGQTLEDYRAHIKEEMERTRLVNREVKSKIVVTDEDIRQYYDTHPEEFSAPAEVHLRHLTLLLDESTGQARRDAARFEMAAIEKALASGTPFDVVAARFADQGPDKRGGDLGKFKVETLSPTLQKAIAGMTPGATTGLLETDQGFQIFYLQEKTGGEKKPLEAVSEIISEKIYKERVNEKFAQWLDELKKTSSIKLVL